MSVNVSSRGESPQSKQSNRYRVPALEKGLDVLEHLSKTGIPLSQAELSRALGRSSSELFRMLACLEQRGYLLRDELSGKYELSLKLYELAHTHSPIDRLLAVARLPLRQLAHDLRESCHIGILRNHQLLIAAQEESPEPIRISIEVGQRFSALQTASGRLLLAHLADDELKHFLATDPEIADLSDTDKRRLEGELTIARQERYVVADSDLTIGVKDISVLIGSPSVGITATVAVPILMLRGYERDLEQIRLRAQVAADTITRELGLNG